MGDELFKLPEGAQGQSQDGGDQSRTNSQSQQQVSNLFLSTPLPIMGQNRRFSVSSLSSTVLFPKAFISQRIVNIEYFMAPPCKDFDNLYSDFRTSAVKRVPIIRIFGTTPAGQKICSNVHGVYPYVTVLDDENTEGLDYRVASALDNAINESVASNRFENNKGQYNPPTQHVFKVVRVSGKTFYGYRPNEEVFLRIFFYNPLILKKAVDLLQSGAILGRRFQPYEAHIPYNLQFMIDYGLYGMNYVHFSAAKFRKSDDALRKEQKETLKDLLSQTQMPSSFTQGSNASISSLSLTFIDPNSLEEGMLGPPELVKQTLCELEVDVLASDIMMITSSKAKSENPGIDCIWKDEMERRRMHGLGEDLSQISIPESQERLRAELQHKAEKKYQEVLWTKVESYFADKDIDFGGSQEMNRSYLDSEFIPSSQVTYHNSLEGNRRGEEGAAQIQMSPEEEEFLKLLEEMANEFEDEKKKDKVEEEDDDEVDSIGMDPSDGEVGGDGEEENAIWDDTLLSQSILQKIDEAEASYEEEKAQGMKIDNDKVDDNDNDKDTSGEGEGQGSVVIQCDGQGGEESDSDKSSVSARTRRSTRRTSFVPSSPSTSSPVKVKKGKSKKKDPIPSPVLVPEAKPTSEEKTTASASTSKIETRGSPRSEKTDSPVTPKFKLNKKYRLSLTYRRLARSQIAQLEAEAKAAAASKVTNSEPADVKKQAEAFAKAIKSTVSSSKDPEALKEAPKSPRTTRQSRNFQKDYNSEPVPVVASNSTSNSEPKPEDKDKFAKPSSPSKKAGPSVEYVEGPPPRKGRSSRRRDSTSSSSSLGSKIKVSPSPTRLSESDINKIIATSPILRLKKIDEPDADPRVKIANPSEVMTSKRERRLPNKFLYSDDYEVKLPQNLHSSQERKSEAKEEPRKPEAETETEPKAGPSSNRATRSRKSTRGKVTEKRDEDLEKISMEVEEITVDKEMTPGGNEDKVGEVEDGTSKKMEVKVQQESLEAPSTSQSQSKVSKDFDLDLPKTSEKQDPRRKTNVAKVDTSAPKISVGTRTRRSLAVASREENEASSKPEPVPEKKKELPAPVKKVEALKKKEQPPPVPRIEAVEKKEDKIMTTAKEAEPAAVPKVPEEGGGEGSKSMKASEKVNSPSIRKRRKRLGMRVCPPRKGARKNLNRTPTSTPKKAPESEVENETKNDEELKDPVDVVFASQGQVQSGEGDSQVSQDSSQSSVDFMPMTPPPPAPVRPPKKKSIKDEEPKTSKSSGSSKDSKTEVKVNVKTFVDEGSNTETKTFKDAGISVKPHMETKILQTIRSVQNVEVQVAPSVESRETQVPVKVFATVSTQTEVETRSLEAQTDAVPRLCLCNCTCVVKEKQDQAIDSQEDLKPEMKNQKIQVDNVDMITHARASRYTTPQSNRIRSGSKTPSRSPEKRRVSRDSPMRRSRNLMTPGHSRYLQALGMKTPVSGSVNRFRGFGHTPTTSTPPPPSDNNEGESSSQSFTPPFSRESKELYLTKVISSSSPSSPKRKFSIKPRNLEVETRSIDTGSATTTTALTPTSISIPILPPSVTTYTSTPEVPMSTAIDPLSQSRSGSQGQESKENDIEAITSLENIELPSTSQCFVATGIELDQYLDLDDRSCGSQVDLSINSIYIYDEEPDRPIEPEGQSSSQSQKETQSQGQGQGQEQDKVKTSIPFAFVKSPLDLPLPTIRLPPISMESHLTTLNQNQIPSTPESVGDSSSEVDTPSVFQQKRNISRARAKHRVEKRKVANMVANHGIRDIFKREVDPLKPAPSFKSLAKWVDGMKRNPDALAKIRKAAKMAEDDDDEDEGSQQNEKWFSKDSSSDEEELPKKVKLFGGGAGSKMDDNSDSDQESSSGSSDDEEAPESGPVKAFTPPIIENLSQIYSQGRSQQSQSSQQTPSSILKQVTPCSSSSLRRFTPMSSKRKIRWEDEPPNDSEDSSQGSSKRLKFDDSQDLSGNKADISELDGPSFKNALGLEDSLSNFQDCKALHTYQFLTSMCIELHCDSRQGLTPDPKKDPILGIFIMVSSDYPEGYRRPKESLSLLIFEKDPKLGSASEFLEVNQKMMKFTSEVAMLEAFIDLVRYWDPEILVGYEVEKSSFGYLIQRGFHLGKDMSLELSRVMMTTPNKNLWRQKEEWNGTISGRIVLNLWRLLRHEIAVQSYTFENAAYHILRRRVYKFPHKTLSAFWSQQDSRDKVIQYYTIRIKGVVQIMEKLDLINRTSELARLFGIQFYEVLSRGSQYRVESMMLRATKQQNYIAPSPGVMQRAKMRAPEYLPLILEPMSNFYTDPVAVLDFQSLYPSMMIAYNYDYASCLGRVEHLGSMDAFPFGCLDLQVAPGDLVKLREHIHVSPCGVAFVDKSLIRGVLPEMLEQILETRQMVKRSMKKWKSEGASLQKVLDSRQLGLKLIANVTYGYTSANFSGRMPCVDIADSIVSKGRETLQRAIDFVKENFDRWGGEVVYGDTDSLFILFKGRTRDEAFKLAYEIADEVTQMNPKPVKLKFEKVYQPCILQSKKRYVGFAYESPDQLKPNYDAKGIETVRRDGCPAVKKILERALHILFSREKAKVEEYVKIQFEKLFKGRVSMMDYIFAREYRGRQGYKPGACVPSLEIAKRVSVKDPRAEPLVSERVPYVVIYGNSSLPLIKLVRTPEEYHADPSMRLNAHYYIEKVIIPALNRCLTLAKLDASKWYLELPRKYLRNVLDPPKRRPKGQGTLDHYVLHQNCMRCEGRTADATRGLCPKCLADEKGSTLYLINIVKSSREKLQNCQEICQTCSGEQGGCVSVDCPVLHKLIRYRRDLPYVRTVENELRRLEW